MSELKQKVEDEQTKVENSKGIMEEKEQRIKQLKAEIQELDAIEHQPNELEERS